MSLLSVALATARTLLNDDVNAVWSDTALIPKAQEAHREMQARLWKVGSPVVRAQSAILTVAADGTFTAPADMLTPFKIMEGVHSAAFSTFTEVTEQAYLPPTSGGAVALKFWAWKGETIVFPTATLQRDIVIYYRRLITVPTAAGDPIGVIMGELWLGARTAAMAHGSVGNTDAFNIISGIAENNFQMVVDAQRGQQSPRQKP